MKANNKTKIDGYACILFSPLVSRLGLPLLEEPCTPPTTFYTNIFTIQKRVNKYNSKAYALTREF